MRRFRHIFNILPLVALLTAGVSCVYDEYVEEDKTGTGEKSVELSIQTRSLSITSDSYSYEVGSQWENYIDLAGGDYRILFFTNNRNDATASQGGKNTLISEFQPSEVVVDDVSQYTRYTISGKLSNAIAAYSNFKVVVLANWGSYPEVTAGETTIDDLVEGANTTFSADYFLTEDGVDSNHLIPFYGVREYSNVSWTSLTGSTTLPGDITLLRAIAKVEVIMEEDSFTDEFEAVSIVGYNSAGYCAPKGVYLRGDYDHDGAWADDFVDDVHLVEGSNDGAGKTHLFNKQSGSTTDTWTIYLPEYDNLSDSTGYSFIRLTLEGDDYDIYFSNYINGEASSTADYDIHRNYLYRFHVTVAFNNLIKVEVEQWNDVFDNDFTFGNMTGNGEILPVGSQIVIRDEEAGMDYCYEVISENLEVMITNELKDQSAAYYRGDVVIPETITDESNNNYTHYTVVAIDEGCFSQGEEITSITIPATIREIGEYAFYECPFLEYVKIYCTELPVCGENMFDSTPTTLLYVPAGYVDMYKNADQWGDFEDIEEIED